jgi:transcriptional regulator with XRE-family HTH domain
MEELFMEEANQWQQLLAGYRTARTMTQGQLAELLGVTITQINRWENGRGTPGKKSQQRIREMLEGRKGPDAEQKLDAALADLREIKEMLRQIIDKDKTKP